MKQGNKQQSFFSSSSTPLPPGLVSCSSGVLEGSTSIVTVYYCNWTFHISGIWEQRLELLTFLSHTPKPSARFSHQLVFSGDWMDYKPDHSIPSFFPECFSLFSCLVNSKQAFFQTAEQLNFQTAEDRSHQEASFWERYAHQVEIATTFLHSQ